jgi:predicted PurR-regulated permease PerM
MVYLSCRDHLHKSGAQERMQQEGADRIYLSSRARAAVVWIAVAVALVFLWQVRSILTPFIWAIVTAYVLNPVVVFLTSRTHWPRRLWATLFYLALLGLVAWGLGTLVPMLSQQLSEFIKEAPQHMREAGRIFREWGVINGDTVDIVGTQINLNAPDAEIRRQLTELVSQQVGRNAVPAIAHGFEGILKLLVYLVSTFFLLLELPRIGQGIASLTPKDVRSELGPWVMRINYVLGAYIRGQLVLVLLMSVTTYIGLTVLGVRFAPLLAIFTGLVETMPFIGPYTAGATAVLVAVTQGAAPFGWTPIVLAGAVAIMYTILRQLEDNFVMPFLIGRLVHLHPLIVIFSVLAGAAIGGILGLLLAVPVAATVKIVLQYLYGKLQEEPPRTLVIIDDNDGWEEITDKVRQAALISKSNGAGRPKLQISVPTVPSALLNPPEFQNLLGLLEESSADAVLLTTDPTLQTLAESAHLPTRDKPQWQPTAPAPDFAESHPTAPLMRHLRRNGNEPEKEPEGAEPKARRRIFSTRPLPVQKEPDEDPTT